MRLIILCLLLVTTVSLQAETKAERQARLLNNYLTVREFNRRGDEDFYKFQQMRIAESNERMADAMERDLRMREMNQPLWRQPHPSLPVQPYTRSRQSVGLGGSGLMGIEP